MQLSKALQMILLENNAPSIMCILDTLLSWDPRTQTSEKKKPARYQHTLSETVSPPPGLRLNLMAKLTTTAGWPYDKTTKLSDGQV